jgi:hypothetical protein
MSCPKLEFVQCRCRGSVSGNRPMCRGGHSVWTRFVSSRAELLCISAGSLTPIRRTEKVTLMQRLASFVFAVGLLSSCALAQGAGQTTSMVRGVVFTIHPDRACCPAETHSRLWEVVPLAGAACRFLDAAIAMYAQHYSTYSGRGLSTRGTARLLRVPSGTVKARVARARRKHKQFVG